MGLMDRADALTQEKPAAMMVVFGLGVFCGCTITWGFVIYVVLGGLV